MRTRGVPTGRLVRVDRGPPPATQPDAHGLAIGVLRESLAIEGVPLGELPRGTRLRIGDAVSLELLEDAPADTESPGGGIVEAPADGPRIRARVVSPGVIHVGDTVVIEVVAVPLDDVLDLHPFRPAEIAEIVREYLAEARSVGLDEVRLIHGRGRGVQRETIRRLLATLSTVAAFHDAPPERGGWGATIVWLRPAPRVPPT
ncbi:MAG: Smr/MutS family protein [Candidatus Rokuibacteriota bacterium]